MNLPEGLIIIEAKDVSQGLEKGRLIEAGTPKKLQADLIRDPQSK